MVHSFFGYKKNYLDFVWFISKKKKRQDWIQYNCQFICFLINSFWSFNEKIIENIEDSLKMNFSYFLIFGYFLGIVKIILLLFSTLLFNTFLVQNSFQIMD